MTSAMASTRAAGSVPTVAPESPSALLWLLHLGPVADRRRRRVEAVVGAGVHLDGDRGPGRASPLDDLHARGHRRPVIELADQDVERRVGSEDRAARILPGAVRVEGHGGSKVLRGGAPVEDHAQRGRRPVGPAEKRHAVRPRRRRAPEGSASAPRASSARSRTGERRCRPVQTSSMPRVVKLSTRRAT